MPAAIQIGVRLREEHCNSRGFVHGGVIATLADNAMGLSYWQVANDTLNDRTPFRGAVTVSLNIDYAATANVGQWLQVEPRVIKAGRSVDGLRGRAGHGRRGCNSARKRHVPS